MVKLKALRPLIGDYGSVAEGQQFETDDARALQLEARGLVVQARPPETKMLRAPENKAMPPAVTGRVHAGTVPPHVRK